MKRILLTLLCCLTVAFVSAQNTSQNYLHTRKMLNSTATGYVDHISYHDGLGRPFQTVEQHWPSSGSTSTLVTQQKYDLLGRPSVSYLPLPGSSSFVSPNSVATSLATHYGDSYAYSTTSYDGTSRERVVTEQGAGSAWQGKVISTEYLSSGTSGDLLCQHYMVDTLANVRQSGAYAAGALQVVKTTDEDGKVDYTFTDKQGRTVLERRMDGTTSFDTYYVYDDYGNLGCVLPPAIDGDITTTNLNRYAYLYRYNDRNLCKWKKLPGVEPVEYVYDNHDRMVFSQDGNQRTSGKWTFYVYDHMNRLVQQGENTSKTVVASDIYIQNYYDDYGFVGTTGFTDNRFTADATKHAMGSLTGTVTDVLGSTTKIYTAYYYDIKGRVTKKVQSNLLGGYDMTTTTYTFTDHPATVTHEHTANGKTARTEVYTYTYDYADRLSSVKHKLGSTEVTLASYAYDNKGRMATKKLHGSSTNQLTYAYNIRNWLSGISGSKFSQNLYYTDGNGTACYNGNLSSMTWKSGDETTLRGYKYTYDGLDRLKAGVYGEGSSLSTNSGRFTESVGSYDKNGNIKAGFVRSGLTSTGSYANLNALTIILNGNQIQAVTDHVPTVAATGGFEFVDGTSETVEYTYDNNGNLTKDSNKGITNITYNCLNLPSTVTFSDGSTIVYSYAADGTKLRAVHTISGTVTQKDYCANVVYENGAQKSLLTEEGYVDLSVSTPAYYYYLKDHQGNNRVVVSSGGTVAEVNHYYPFGGVFASSGNVQPYKYNGKELDTKKGLNWYDYGARHYDATIGRWFVMDPLAEKYYAWSPYAYCFNNPMRFIDPNGKDGWDIIVGYGIGLLTNILPNTGFIRDSYIPTDVSDYNNALQGMDNASMVIGAGMIAGGGGAIITGETMTATGLALTVGSVGSASAVLIPTAVSGVVVTETGAITVAAGVNMMNNAQQNKSGGYNRGKQNGNDDITFTQGTGKNAKKITTSIPEGFKKIKERTKNNMPIYKKGKEYISPDRDGHNGGVWKKAKSIEDLNNRKTRLGTYDENLNRIGD